MKNIRKFETVADYEAWMSGDAVYPNVCYVAEDGRIAYNPPPPLPLYIEAIENLTVTFSNTYEYSKDNRTWTSATSSTSISANAGEKVYFRASGLTTTSTSKIGSFYVTKGNYNIGGNIMSMAYGADFEGKTEITQESQFRQLFRKSTNQERRLVDASNLILPATTLAERCYESMFEGQTALTAAPVLPATTLVNYCYYYMFNGCTSLVNAPALPATTLADACYSSMFEGCTSLVNAPDLPATTLASTCCLNMFRGCTSLVNAPDLPATTCTYSCYRGMFYGCTSLVNAPMLPATTLDSDCYREMFYDCTSLVNAPDLPATTCTYSCYYDMFYGCTSLVNAPMLPATSLAEYCYYNMFRDCTSLVNAPDLPATTLALECYSDMFYNCESLVNAPVLPAVNLKSKCYARMFAGCSGLNYIKAMFTTTPSTNYTQSWVSGVASTGTFVKNSAATWDVTGINGTPEGWTVELADA